MKKWRIIFWIVVLAGIALMIHCFVPDRPIVIDPFAIPGYFLGCGLVLIGAVGEVTGLALAGFIQDSRAARKMWRIVFQILLFAGIALMIFIFVPPSYPTSFFATYYVGCYLLSCGLILIGAVDEIISLALLRIIRDGEGAGMGKRKAVLREWSFVLGIVTLIGLGLSYFFFFSRLWPPWTSLWNPWAGGVQFDVAYKLHTVGLFLLAVGGTCSAIITFIPPIMLRTGADLSTAHKLLLAAIVISLVVVGGWFYLGERAPGPSYCQQDSDCAGIVGRTYLPGANDCANWKYYSFSPIYGGYCTCQDSRCMLYDD